MMLVGKIINIIGCMLCIFAARKFAKEGNACMTILFCTFILGFWSGVLAWKNIHFNGTSNSIYLKKGRLLTEADKYYDDGKRTRRYFDMYVSNDGVQDDDTVKVTDLGKIGGKMIDLYKEKKDISNERVTHMMIITDPETGN